MHDPLNVKLSISTPITSMKKFNQLVFEIPKQYEDSVLLLRNTVTLLCISRHFEGNTIARNFG